MVRGDGVTRAGMIRRDVSLEIGSFDDNEARGGGEAISGGGDYSARTGSIARQRASTVPTCFRDDFTRICKSDRWKGTPNLEFEVRLGLKRAEIGARDPACFETHCSWSPQKNLQNPRQR